MRIAPLVLAVSVVATPATAQQVIGHWGGKLDAAPGVTLRIAVHVDRAKEGAGLVGTLDSIDQSASGIPLGEIVQSGDRLNFTVPAVAGRYEGRWDPATRSWIGDWSQGAGKLPLTLSPGEAPPSGPVEVPANWTMPKSSDVAALLDAALDGRPGLVAAAGIFDRGSPVVIARSSKDARVDSSTVFEIGSITKVLTSLLLADMAVKGEVKLDDPVSRHLPTGALSDHGARPITLRDLAMHHSGLPRLPANLQPADPQDPYADYDEARMLAFLQAWKPTRAPGAMFEYSNFGAGLLGYALARAAGKPYPALVEERILKPLGMASSGFTVGTGEAIPHDGTGKAAKPWRLTALTGAGGLRSTPLDMVKFARALADPPVGLKAAVDLMLAERKPAGVMRADIALGLFIIPTTAGDVVFHDGGTGGFQSGMVVDRARKRGAVVLVNSAAPPQPTQLAMHLVTGIPIPKSDK